MKNLIFFLLLLALLLTGCGEMTPPDTGDAETEAANNTELVDGTEKPEPPDTEKDEDETEKEAEKETESDGQDQTTEEGTRVILLDYNRDGVNDARVVVDLEAAKRTDKVPFRIADAENPSEDSFRTVSLYRLTEEGETLIWYTNLCMGSTPRGGVGLSESGAIFTWYFDEYAVEGGRRLSISCYEFGSYGGTVGLTPNLKRNSVVTNIISDADWEEYGERHLYNLQAAVDMIDEMLYDAEILLDVMGTLPIGSTDENRFTKSYADKFDYRTLDKCLDAGNQSDYIIPAR